jgi:hypothetical protein
VAEYLLSRCWVQTLVLPKKKKGIKKNELDLFILARGIFRI